MRYQSSKHIRTLIVFLLIELLQTLITLFFILNIDSEAIVDIEKARISQAINTSLGNFTALELQKSKMSIFAFRS